MAERYAVATGSWNSTSTWSATFNGSSGASVPTINDDVYIVNNYTITLGADAFCQSLGISAGTLTCGDYNMTIRGNWYSASTSPRTINMGNSTWTVGTGSYSTNLTVDFSGSGTLTLNAQNSILILNPEVESGMFSFNNKTFNDIRINLISNYACYLTDGFTCRSLYIDGTRGSSSNTVEFGGNVGVSKLIVIGGGVSSRLKLVGGISMDFGSRGSCYGQYVQMGEPDDDATEIWAYSDDDMPAYIGDSSINNSFDGNIPWLLQDPPKIATLVDSLTIAPGSNPNWAVSGTITQLAGGAGGGGYRLTSGATMRSTDTYDLVSDSIVIERIEDPTGTPSVFMNGGTLYLVVNAFAGGEYAAVSEYTNPTNSDGDLAFSYPMTSEKYLKLSLVSDILKWQVSDDASLWTDVSSVTIDSSSTPYYRSINIDITANGNYAIGSINVLPTSQNPGAFLQFF